MKTTEIRIGKDIFKIKMYKDSCNDVKWYAYRHREQKKWWQLSYWEYFIDGWVIIPRSMEEVLEEITNRISKEVLETDRRSVVEKEWDNF